MSNAFVATLSGVVVVALVARLTWRRLPLAAPARRVSATDLVLVVVGVAGLVFHCGAMFFVDTFDRLPLSGGVIDAIRGMGTSSALLYAAPAGLVLLGLRRQHLLALAVLALAFVAVGVTMYDSGPLDTHLAAILGSVVVLAGVVSTLVIPPWAPEPSTR